MAPVHSAASSPDPSPGSARAPASARGRDVPLEREPGSARAPASIPDFERALAILTVTQRRVLRCLLTGASLPLIAGVAGVDPRDIEAWLVDGGALHHAIAALHRALPAPLGARLRAGILRELRALDGSAHEPAARATLAIVRVLGHLDSELRLLDHPLLRRDDWSAGAP
jgi:hypothetical protein